MFSPWTLALLDRLAQSFPSGYHAGSPPASEPTALAALALMAYDRADRTTAGVTWLLDHQTKEGSVGVNAEQETPIWPTSLAAICWLAARRHSLLPDEDALPPAIDRAIAAILRQDSCTEPRKPGLGHDPTLNAWPWVEGTHGWIEPTALHVLALKQTGHADDPRTREAVRMLADRMFVTGGCNYGNTKVFGQMLRPHVQPSGVSLMALADEGSDVIDLAPTIAWLEEEVIVQHATSSLCFGLMGLSATGRAPAELDPFLSRAAERQLAREASPYKLALLLLAALDQENPLLHHLRSSRKTS